MGSADDTSIAALVQVITGLRTELSAVREDAARQREDAVRQREDAARQREEDRKEMARLVKMIEGLTRQLDAMLGEMRQAEKAELARTRAEAQAIAAAAAARRAAAGEPAPAPAGTKPPPRPRNSNRSKHGRGELPAHLPRETVPVKPTECDACRSAELLARDEVVSEELDYVRAHVRVRRTVRAVCLCGNCGARVTPPAPPMPFDRASCTMEMMAWLCFAKCGLFLPLDRLRRDFADQGAQIASSTMTRWWQRGADLLLPVAESVRLSLLTGSHIQTDGTGLRVVFPRQKASPVKGPDREGEVDETGYLQHRPPENGQILFFGDDKHAVYHFTPDKCGEHLETFLTLGVDEAGNAMLWTGTITADAASNHDRLFLDGDRIESGCNAHSFRKFRDDADKAPLLASRAMAFIDGFYKVEAEAREENLAGAELLARRRARAGPQAKAFKDWLDTHITDLLPSHPVRKAMQYCLNHWEALTRFLEDPAVPLDNNASERALRKVALLRNNSLYASGEDGAVRLCTMLTLIQTCRLIEVEPYAYLVWALTRVVPHPDNRGLTAADLTPPAYKAAQQRDAE